MTKTQEEINKMRENLIYFIEHLFIHSSDGSVRTFKMTETQKLILEGIIQNGFKKFQIVSSSRIRKGYRL